MSPLTVTMMLAAPVHAEVTQSSSLGFVSKITIAVAAPRREVFHALTQQVDAWWDPAHSYSGDAGNFTLSIEPPRCLCERLPNGGSVVHMNVIFADPPKQLRLTGGLGPLQTMAVTGPMTFDLVETDVGTELSYTYVVGGFTPGGLEALAEPVDRVQAGQLARLKAFVETQRR